ncbi:hypothetical protein EYR40_003159 [Pleurotus pulmonarius]|nr:hypothetical protein EYR40_003159 [Pleurotus pulmonarius]
MVSSSYPTCSVAFVPPQLDCGQFAFARVNGDVCLVQISLSTPPSSKVGTTEVKVFRHEFITIFRLSHSMTLSSSDLRILEPIDDEVLKYEEEKETVFLAKELVEQLRRMTDPRFQQPRMRYTSHPSHRRR